MNYKGKLYGRLAGTFFDTGKTSEDWDALEERAKALEAQVLAIPSESEIDARIETELDVGRLGQKHNLDERTQAIAKAALKAGAKWFRDEFLIRKCSVCGKPETAAYSPCCSMDCWTQQFEEPKPINQ